MSKKIKIGISILLLVIMISVHVSYAIGSQNEKDFFKVNKEEISPEETLEMTFDISSLKYNKFKILLKSNVNSEDIYTENNQENVSIDNDENAISIDVDKEKLSLNEIKLYYPIPKEMAIGTKIQFTAQIIVNNEIKEENKTTNTTRDNTVANELEVDNNNTKNLENKIKPDNNTQNLENEIKKDNNNQEEVVTEKISKTITVVEKKIETDKNDADKEQSEDKNPNESKIPNTEKNNSNQEKTNNQSEKMSSSNMSNQKMSSNINSGSSLSNLSINNENQATYNGSNNNYLSKLEIDGMELNTSFNKEYQTYFIKTNSTNTINVIATAEDSTAKINITGNDTIQNGNNKILISVTAENGDVRYYRIFVNCEEGTDET